MTKPTETLRDRRRLNRGDMAALLGVSLTKMDQMVRQGCPIAQRPGQGKASVFNTLEVLQWYFAPRTASVEDPEKLEPGDRKSWYEGEAKRREIAEGDAGLVPADQVREAVTLAHHTVASRLGQLATDLTIGAGLTPEQAGAARTVLAAALADFTDRLSVYAPALAGQALESGDASDIHPSN